MNEAFRGRIPVLARGSNPWVLECHKLQKKYGPIKAQTAQNWTKCESITTEPRFLITWQGILSTRYRYFMRK